MSENGKGFGKIDRMGSWVIREENSPGYQMTPEQYKECGVTIPPNLDRLSPEDRVKWEEDVYYTLYKRKWSFMPGDPRLKSIGKLNDLEVD